MSAYRKNMTRINYFVREDQLEKLRVVSEQYDIPISELIRRFIDQGLERFETHDTAPARLTLDALAIQVQSQEERLAAIERMIQRLRSH